MSDLIERWQAWFIETLEGNGANFITAERDGENWNFRRFTRDPQAATIARLQAELAEAREVPGRIVAWLREEAGKDAGDHRRLHAEKKLTPLMTEGWDTLIQTKTGIATAIEARDWSKP